MGANERAPEQKATVPEQAWSLPAAPEAVPGPGPECDAFVRVEASSTPSCTPSALASALGAPPHERDGALSALEACAKWPSGLVRALRAELAPSACGDVVVASALGGAGARPDREMSEVLLALGLAGRLSRLAVQPPAAPASREKSALDEYFRQRLFPWISRQADAIRDLSSAGASLRGYAQGVIAVEAGMADMRFVEIARAVPIPAEMAADAELRDTYYASLDEALEPRKTRGRDAALVGLAQLARVGVLRSPRLTAARELLARVYGAQRVSALDALLLPPLPPLALPSAANDAAEDTAVSLLARVPTYYAPLVVPEGSASGDEAEARRLRAALEQGPSHGLQQALVAARPGERTELLLIRAKLDLGRTYFRAEDFAAAERLSAGRKDPEGVFLRALATALVAGPRNAAELISRGPRFADALGNLEALDDVAASSSPWAGAAAFNAAYLRELVAPPGDAAYWQALHARYMSASRKLEGAERREAEARASAAHQTARAIEKR